MKIGVLSDTHGKLNPGIATAFDGVDMILHAGDIGDIRILYELEGIAPVQAVFGNSDSYIIAGETREQIVFEEGGVNFALTHGAGAYNNILERLANMFHGRGIDIIVFGHTHKPYACSHGEHFFFNPGCASGSVGIIELNGNGSYKTQIIEL
ncbi:MAG: YfcE family phosphodiesterase [Firmicutes bacterium]|nr:YfcE family phosphodiesterase [Bacillota bacterium]